MTVRQLFAAMAMQGLASNPYFTERAFEGQFGDGKIQPKVADLAVHFADRLIEELSKEKK